MRNLPSEVAKSAKLALNKETVRELNKAGNGCSQKPTSTATGCNTCTCLK